MNRMMNKMNNEQNHEQNESVRKKLSFIDLHTDYAIFSLFIFKRTTSCYLFLSF